MNGTRTALITGANKRIGLETVQYAKELAGTGIKVNAADPGTPRPT